MFIQQFYTACLAEAAYYIESEGEAAIIDPLWEIQHYIDYAEQRGAKIKYVFETHFHEDFVSGHLELVRETGAIIIFGPGAQQGYDTVSAHDNDVFSLGNIKIKMLHTPGHTLDSCCFLLIDNQDKPRAVFTGDTLLVGEVGRPDLTAGKQLSFNDLAELLFHSLNTKIKTLPDSVIVYPGHGAGSACGRNISKEAYSTIGVQKQTNYALQEMTKESFIRALTNTLPESPKYFFMDSELNKDGLDSFAQLIQKNLVSLSVTEVEQEIKKGATVLDTRDAMVFAKAFIPSGINIGMNGQLAVWAGALLDPHKPIIIVADIGKEEEAIMRLARVGYGNIIGFLENGMNTWMAERKETDTIATTEARQFALIHNTGLNVLDLRNLTEFASGIVPGAHCIPLHRLNANITRFDMDDLIYVYCAGGYRSMIGCSILKKAGFKNLVHINGGMTKIAATGISLEMVNIISA